MNERLVWNFEINTQKLLELPLNHARFQEDVSRWEVRYFWPHHQFILIQGLIPECFTFANVKCKQHRDTYYLLKDYPYNIKHRRTDEGVKWVYKPLLDIKNNCQSFGKKINLKQVEPDCLLEPSRLSAATLLSLIETQSMPVFVEKSALTYSLRSEPSIKIELSRIQINGGAIFFSASIEGYSYEGVNTFRQRLFPQEKPSDYIEFLKQYIYQPVKAST